MLRAGAHLQPTGPVSVAHDCGLVTALEAVTGWLLVTGVLIAVFGAAVIVTGRAAVTRPAARP